MKRPLMPRKVKPSALTEGSLKNFHTPTAKILADCRYCKSPTGELFDLTLIERRSQHGDAAVLCGRCADKIRGFLGALLAGFGEEVGR